MQRWLDRIVRDLRTVLPEEPVARTARATSLVERNRKIGSVPFLWSFLFGTTQPDSSVTKVQDFYKTFTDHDAAYSSIQQWITPELKILVASQSRLEFAFVGFREYRFRVLLPDSPQ
jgi:putative transposase